MNTEKLTELCDKLGCRMTLECSLKEYVTFKIGGKCRALININSVKAVTKIIKYLKSENIDYFIIGRGSNILVADEGFDGVILLFGSDFAKIEVSGNEIKCDSGALLASACVHAQQEGLTGMENLFGIPGTVGGALYMNAGAYGSEIADVVASAEYIDEDCNLRYISRESMELSYRHSFFSGKPLVITSVTFRLPEGNPDDIRLAMTECIKKRTSKQPLEFASAGSTFKRPEGSYASLLIDQCGLKGFTVGGAMISEKHSGFVINKGFATCADVLELCGKVQQTVKEKTGYTLELEPVILK